MTKSFALRQTPQESPCLRHLCKKFVRSDGPEWRVNRFDRWIRTNFPGDWENTIMQKAQTTVKSVVYRNYRCWRFSIFQTLASFEKKTTTISESECARQELKTGVNHCSFSATQTHAVNRSSLIIKQNQIKTLFWPITMDHKTQCFDDCSNIGLGLDQSSKRCVLWPIVMGQSKVLIWSCSLFWQRSVDCMRLCCRETAVIHTFI